MSLSLMKKYTINQVHESKLLKQKRPSHIYLITRL